VKVIHVVLVSRFLSMRMKVQMIMQQEIMNIAQHVDMRILRCVVIARRMDGNYCYDTDSNVAYAVINAQ